MFYLSKQKWISVYLTMTFLFTPFLSLLTFAAKPAQAGVVLGEEVNLTPYGVQRAGHSDPDIYESKVVWVDDRNNNMDIYMKDLTTGAETQVTSNITDQYQPTIFGNRVAWVDQRNGNRDIFVKDLTTGVETAVVSNSSDQSNPKLNGDTLIYEERPADAWWYWASTEIYTKNLVTGVVNKLATGTNADAPDIWGNLAAWRKDSPAEGIWLTELETGFSGQISNNTQVSNASLNFSPPSIYQNLVTWSQGGPDSGIWLKDIGGALDNISNGSYQSSPDIFGTNIVWEKTDESWGNSRIYRKDLSGGVISELTSNGTMQYSPKIYDTKVVWEDSRNGTSDIFVKDLATGDEAQVNSDETFKRADQVSGDIDGEKVVWVDNRMEAPGLYYKDLVTGTETRFKEIPLISNTSGQWNPRISGDNVVWADTMNEPFGIYTTNLSTMTENVISAGTNQFAPAISGNLVAWQKLELISNGTAQSLISRIFTREIGGPPPVPVSNGTRQYDPDVSGSKIVWQEYLSTPQIWLKNLIDNSSMQISNSSNYWDYNYGQSIDGDKVVWTRNGDILVKDLFTGLSKKIGTGWSPSISGNIVVWMEYNNGFNIVVLDVSNSSKNKISIPDWASDPRISGNRVIWTDYRNGDADIYTRTFSLNSSPPLEEWISVSDGLTNTDVISLAVSPNYAVDQTIFAGTSGGGALKSIDGGNFWTRLNLDQMFGHVSVLVVSPNYTNDQTIFADDAGAYATPGIFKSEDGGNSWTTKSAPFSDSNELAISPNYANDQTIFAITGNGLFKSVDSGNSWTPKGPIGVFGGMHIAISTDFANDQTIFANFYGSNGGLFKSVDGGNNWTYTGLYVTGSIVVSPNYASDQTVFTAGDFMNKSTDGGNTWIQINPLGSNGFWISDLAVSSNYASDQTIFAGTWSNGIFKSTSGGNSWVQINFGLENVNVLTLAVSSYGGYQNLFVGTWGSGVYKYIFGGQQDLTAPATTIETSGTIGNNNWFKTVPTITLTPDETATTYYSWDFASPEITYTVSLTAPEGNHTLHYYSVDSAGNAETDQSREFNIDTEKPQDPTTISSPSHVLNKKSKDNTVDINFSGAVDLLSGIDGYAVSWSMDGTESPAPILTLQEDAVSLTSEALTEGTWYINISTKDNAGNWTSTVHYGPFLIEKINTKKPGK